ncbi:Carboxypeptidase regulatory-like domain-containing protein [Bryocella elongata]|uniref:Carboxypeptidase regulatory-like domain-containing protein n=1 Tax=Bryocella elongata TaxID=863522 RepID=A0A1H6ABI8_9BACT|nr:carboxypeptidase regulatory-like domain-containing protein [Bryocella elongata]SEG45670.1 Carboxypeptidase regulatory-like domain-containing protein [Bryocella elongata]
MLSFPRVTAGHLALSFAALFMGAADGQQTRAELSLNGQVVDPSGARVPHAAISILGASVHIDTETNDLGEFSVRLQDGDYDVIVEATGFRRVKTEVGHVQLEAGHNLGIRLAIATKDEHIEVDRDGSSTSSGDNLSATVIGERELMSLSDDENTFQKQLLAMAGSLGNSPSVYVDGFTGGKIPPKSSILSVRINHDPYSAQYDALGFGRIEIESKAGGPRLHGSVGVGGTQQALNAQDPFSPSPQPAYYVLNTDASLSGPVDHKSTFFASGVYNDQQNNAAVNALIPTLFSTAVPNPQKTSSATVRGDRQFSQRSMLTMRYQLDRVTLTNGGVGQLVLPSEGHASTSTNQTLQFTHESIANARIVNQARFEYIRTRLDQRPEQTASGPCTTAQIASCTVIVQGSFAGGGDPAGVLNDHRDHLEGEDFLSIELSSHFLRTGVRYRWTRESNTSTAAFNGQFVFTSLANYAAALPAQFNLTTGDPAASAATGDLGIYAEDEWKARKDLTINYGVRIESQTGIPDHFNVAPRAGLAWAPKHGLSKTPVLTLRGGAGVFFNRFEVENLLTAEHQNGVREQSGYVTDPATLNKLYEYGFTSASLGAAQPMVYRVDPNLKVSHELIATVSAERRFSHYASVTATYLWARGIHEYLSINANAPEPGTGVRPYGGTTDIYEFTGRGIEKDQAGMVNWRITPTPKVMIYGLYVNQSKQGSAQHATDFASNSYNVSQDFGREAVRRHQLFSGAMVTLPWGFSLNGYLSWQSGMPFNITTGTDLNGDTIYNDRPTFATSASPAASVVATRWGTFNTSPVAGESVIPVNYGTGPGLLYLSTSITRAFTLGGRVEGSGKTAHRQGGTQLSFTAEADNLTNNVNALPPVGVLSSSLFGRSLAQDTSFSSTSAANRILFLRANFSF